MVNLRAELLVAIKTMREKLTSSSPQSLEDMDRNYRETQTRAVMALMESQETCDGDSTLLYGPRRYTG